jgi:hypothetical protein
MIQKLILINHGNVPGQKMVLLTGIFFPGASPSSVLDNTYLRKAIFKEMI